MVRRGLVFIHSMPCHAVSCLGFRALTHPYTFSRFIHPFRVMNQFQLVVAVG